MAQEHHARITISNTTKGNLKRVSGDQHVPETILQGNSVFFVTANSEGYVIYEGPNVQGGPSNCGWLLVWNVPSRGNQVYVECGPIGSIKAIPVDEIKKKVKASRSSSTGVGGETKTSASAVVEAIADTPTLGCGFSVDN